MYSHVFYKSKNIDLFKLFFIESLTLINLNYVFPFLVTYK